MPWYNAGETGAKAAMMEDVSGRHASKAVNPPPFDLPQAYIRDLSTLYV